MINELDNREARVLDFINNKNKERDFANSRASIQSSPELKMRKLNDECKKGVSICLDTILGKVYKDALPFDDPKKNCSDDDACCMMHDFIAKRTGGRDSEYYVREAIKRTNSTTLKNILTEAENMAKKFYQEKSKELVTINLDDLNFKNNIDTEDLDKITAKTELDEVSNIIQNNVQKTIDAEVAKSKKEDETNQLIEDQLTNDDSVVDDASMESAMEKLNVVKQPTIYQPSLFEAIMLSNMKNVNESVTAAHDAFDETVHEFTMLNVVKALKLERFELNDVRKLANSYL